MPYESVSDLPPAVKDKYSAKCQRAFMHAFNSTHDRTGDESRSFAAGHSAARRCQESKSMPEPKFEIFSGALKTLDFNESDGVRRMKTTASSTFEDLAGDVMTKRALESMKRSAERGMTIFLNHRYNVPEDVLGSVEKAELSVREDNVDLDFTIRVEESNPRAVKTWEAIQNGTQLGCSIGAMIPEGGAKRAEKGLVIDDVHLLEASIVGIPANPRAFAHYAAKSFFEAEQSDDPDSEVIEAAVTGAVKGVANGLPVDQTLLTRLQSNTANSTLAIKADTTPKDDEKTSEEAAPERNENEPNDGPVATSPADLRSEPSEESDNAPAEEADSGDAADDTEKSADVPTTQEAPESAPESDGAEDVTDDLTAKSFDVIKELVRTTASELRELRAKHAELELAKQAAETRATDAEENLRIARDIIEGIAALPLGRRTSFAGKVSEFRTRLSGIYDPELLKFVENKSNE